MTWTRIKRGCDAEVKWLFDKILSFDEVQNEIADNAYALRSGEIHLQTKVFPHTFAQIIYDHPNLKLWARLWKECARCCGAVSQCYIEWYSQKM